uniref:G_PROTEIN_RECEP_F1_2 domain-containing protein n=1 Tax=Parastrongyloides trichosuri TaxID=131310 RepID=A0A0N5A0Q1_PARTI
MFQPIAIVGLIFTIIGCIVSLFLIPMIGSFTWKRKEWHNYFRSALLSLLLACFFHVFASIFVYSIVLFTQSIPISGDDRLLMDIYNKPRFLLKGSCAVVRICIWVMVIERTIATIKRKNYQNYNNYGITAIIFFLPFAYGFNVNNIGKIWQFFDDHYIKFSMAIDLITVMVLIILWILNSKLRKTISGIEMDLTEKFQITENIRLIKLSLPVTITYLIDNFIFNIIYETYNLTVLEDETIVLINYASLIYCYLFFIFNIIYQYSNLFPFLKYMKKNKIGTCSRRTQTKDDEINNKNIKLQNIKIINANNKEVPMNYDQKSYFNVYAKAWQKMSETYKEGNIFDVALITENIAKNLINLTDLKNLSTVNKSCQEGVTRHVKKTKIIPKLPIHEVYYNEYTKNEVRGTYLNESGEFSTLNEDIERFKKIIDGKIVTDAEVVINYSINMPNKNDKLFMSIGKQIASYINKLFDLYQNASTLVFMNKSFESEELLLVFIVSELKSFSIKNIYGLDFFSINEYYTVRKEHLENVDVFNGLPNIKKVVFRNSLSGFCAYDDTLTECSMKYLIKCLGKKNNTIIGLPMFYAYPYSKRLGNIMSYAHDRKVDIHLYEESNRSGLYYETFRDYAFTSNSPYINAVTTFSSTIANLGIMNQMKELIAMFPNLKTLSIEAQFKLEYKRKYSGCLVPDYNPQYYCNENFGITKFHPSAPLKSISIKLCDLISPMSENPNIYKEIKYHFIKNLIGKLPNTVTNFSLQNINSGCQDVLKLLSEKCPHIREMKLQKVEISDDSIIAFNELQFLLLSEANYIKLPKTLFVLIYEIIKEKPMKDNNVEAIIDKLKDENNLNYIIKIKDHERMKRYILSSNYLLALKSAQTSRLSWLTYIS